VTIAAADLLGFRLCTGQCLLGLEDFCTCRCRGRWHAVLADAEIPVSASLTLAAALATGPVGRPHRGRRHHDRHELGPEAARIFSADLDRGEIPGIRSIRRELHIGQTAAQRVQAFLRDRIDT
jgi:hypothetical protein